MIKLFAVAAFALAVATSAQAMTLAPLSQPDGVITQARMGCGAGRVMVNDRHWCCSSSASPLSVSLSTIEKGFTLSQDKAAAAVGKPLSAGSVAGVHRRQERRGHHSTTNPIIRSERLDRRRASSSSIAESSVS